MRTETSHGGYLRSVKIYTKTGDSGKTSLYSGQRVSKADLRLHAYGSLDELNAHVGLLRDQASEFAELQGRLLEVQSHLFSVGSHMANDNPEMVGKLPAVHGEWTGTLEAWIDGMDVELEPLRNFVLPGGHVLVSQAHVARTVCRRAERWCTQLDEALHDSALPLPAEVLPYLNRLSDYFFTLSRWLSVRVGAPETPWKPKA